MVRFAVVTDIHYGFDAGNKKGSKAPELIDRFVRVANKNRVDFAVDLGDRVITTAAECDAFYQKKLTEHFNRLTVPKFSVDGNHDVSKQAPNPSHIQSINGFTFIFWNPNIRIQKPDGLSLRPEDLKWLKDSLEAAKAPCVILSHVPFDNFEKDNVQALKRDTRPFISFYKEGAQVRDIIEQSGKVLLCLAGHRHRPQKREINGIHYLTLQSLVQRDTQSSHAKGAFYLFEIDDAGIRVKSFGRGQKSFALNRPDAQPHRDSRPAPP